MYCSQMRSRNAISSVWERFSGFWSMCVSLPFLKYPPRLSYTSCTAWTNPQISNRSQESTGTDPYRVDGSQGTSIDQAHTHIFTFTPLCIFPSADRSQGNREYSYGTAQLDCHFWRQFDGKGAFYGFRHIIRFRSSLILIYGRLQTAILRHVLSSPRYHVLHFDLRIAGFADLCSLHMSLWLVLDAQRTSSSDDLSFQSANGTILCHYWRDNGRLRRIRS